MTVVLKALLKIFDSVLHAYGLVALLIVLVILPLLGVHVSQFIELVGGNYTNVISALAASIAASTSLKTRADNHFLHNRLIELERKLHLASSQVNHPPMDSRG